MTLKNLKSEQIIALHQQGILSITEILESEAPWREFGTRLKDYLNLHSIQEDTEVSDGKDIGIQEN